MGVESIVICVDNSEWMRNGDFIPTRLHAQQDAVNVVARFKTKENVETSIGLLTFSDTQVRVPLTTDYNKIAKSLQTVEPKGSIKFLTGIRIAHLVLKHRLNRNHRTRIIAFVASPISEDMKEMERLAKRLKKEKIHVDVVSFGEEEENIDKLSHFIETINGTEQKECHLVQARPGPMLSDILINSPIMVGEDGKPIGSGFDFSMDPMAADDPELAMALRVSLEEQRQRQDEETRRVQQESLEQMQTGEGMNQAMETEETETTDASTLPGTAEREEEDVEMQELMQNKEFLQSVLSSLPGVNPEEALQNYRR
ncbi:26S proteasome non-ATPase regulatory subunit 4-like [Gigantopelta aegis]|uniref:26S proteasome non-ATPase regulatory subunit 4-like n=1 Tax=Gigantopelta aegis TaxID=1735272 RepID=UPI001B88A9DE|nr:26S proteasome non-ATPase regulatory subunit 4-like [Gigantopelta aegis]